jgi:uncharacterized membrane protein YqhA
MKQLLCHCRWLQLEMLAPLELSQALLVQQLMQTMYQLS